MSESLEREDIQALVARGFADLKAATYVLLRFDDAWSARPWLGSLPPQLTSAAQGRTQTALNIAVTAHGLAQLGLPATAMQQFSNALTAGMATPHRSRSMGDVGASAPQYWAWGGPRTPPVDALLLLFARDPAALARLHETVARAYAGVSELGQLDATVDLDGKEHFGFADGISQPTVESMSSRTDIPPNTIAAGEFVLGYLNEYGQYTDRPLLEPLADPQRVLARDVKGSGKADFGRNGSYLIFRHLSQDVRGFWRYVHHAAGERATWLAAKMVGRWPGGAPLTLSPEFDDPLLSTANDFTFQYSDALGLGCPIGAHVRRCHPRDSLDPKPGTARSVALDKRHRLLRRGREYGPPVDDVLAPATPDDADRGLYFICLAGNIERQFEFIQSTWLNDPQFDELYDEPDPLVGDHCDGNAHFSVPADPVRLRYSALPRFVTVRGGAYFFLPGLRALRYLTE
jgi:Dyp-type peroxidase family